MFGQKFPSMGSKVFGRKGSIARVAATALGRCSEIERQKIGVPSNKGDASSVKEQIKVAQVNKVLNRKRGEWSFKNKAEGSTSLYQHLPETNKKQEEIGTLN